MNNQPFLKRLFIYQKERFPVLQHGLLIAAFSFSAIGFSRQCRAVEGFIPWSHYAACVFTNFALFFLLRVSDEYKDHKDDLAHRTYLPVIRGLISLKELAVTGIILFSTAVVINVIYFPQVLPFLGLAFGYLLLMRYEFGIGEWLKRNMHWYIVSHMVIIPLADVYASSFDWRLNNVSPSIGLIFFFAISFVNGIVLEVGRKLRSLEQEEEGVVSYTRLWGVRKAPLIWVALTSLNFMLACVAAMYAHANPAVFVCLGLIYLVVLMPALSFYRFRRGKDAKRVEIAAYIWAITMYLALGGIPQLWSVIFHK